VLQASRAFFPKQVVQLLRGGGAGALVLGTVLKVRPSFGRAGGVDEAPGLRVGVGGPHGPAIWLRCGVRCVL
jgi:hypothetical protein